MDLSFCFFTNVVTNFFENQNCCDIETKAPDFVLRGSKVTQLLKKFPTFMGQKASLARHIEPLSQSHHSFLCMFP